MIKSAIIEKASIDEVYLDVTEEALRRLNAVENDVIAFNALVTLARFSSIAGEDEIEMKMSKNILRKGHSGTKKDDEEHSVSDGPNVRDWFDQPHYMWNQDDKLLLCGAIICDELRFEVLKQLNYSCSGGVAHNKMLSKIASAMHKPNKQTLVPTCVVRNMMACIPINRVAGFGGKLGESLADFGSKKIEKFSDLIEIGKNELSTQFGDETTIWMLNAANGIDHTPVEQRALTASIGCGKSYRQKNTLPPIALQDGRVLHWLRKLSEELEERIQMDTDMNSRKPKQVTVGMSIAYVQPPKDLTTNLNVDPCSVDPVRKWNESQGMSLSKVFPICVGALAVSKAAHAMAVRAVAESTRLHKPWNITYLSLSASGFVPIANDNKAISSFFKSALSPQKLKAARTSPCDKIQDTVCGESDVIQSAVRIENKEGERCDKIPNLITNIAVDLDGYFSTNKTSGTVSTFMNSIDSECEDPIDVNSNPLCETVIKMLHTDKKKYGKNDNFLSVYGNGDNDNENSNTQGGALSDDDVEDGVEENEGASSIREISSYYITNKNNNNNDNEKGNDKSSFTNNSKNRNLKYVDDIDNHVSMSGMSDLQPESDNQKTPKHTSHTMMVIGTNITDKMKAGDMSGTSQSLSQHRRDEEVIDSNGDRSYNRDKNNNNNFNRYNSDNNHNNNNDNDNNNYNDEIFSKISSSSNQTKYSGRNIHNGDNDNDGNIFDSSCNDNKVNHGINNDCNNNDIDKKINDDNDNTDNYNNHYNKNVSDIDMDVFNALPTELQRELSIALKIPYDTKQSYLVTKNAPNSKKSKLKGFVSHNANSDVTDKTTPIKISSFFENQSINGVGGGGGGGGGGRGREISDKSIIDNSYLKDRIDESGFTIMEER